MINTQNELIIACTRFIEKTNEMMAFPIEESRPVDSYDDLIFFLLLGVFIVFILLLTDLRESSGI